MEKIFNRNSKKSVLLPDWRRNLEEILNKSKFQQYPELYMAVLRILHTPEAEETLLALKEAADAAGVDLDIGIFIQDIIMVINPSEWGELYPSILLTGKAAGEVAGALRVLKKHAGFLLKNEEGAADLAKIYDRLSRRSNSVGRRQSRASFAITLLADYHENSFGVPAYSAIAPLLKVAFPLKNDSWDIETVRVIRSRMRSATNNKFQKRGEAEEKNQT